MILQESNSIFQKLIPIAEKAGDAILSFYKKNNQVEYKLDKSPITFADKASHKIIDSQLKKIWPNTLVLSEENNFFPGNILKKEFYWAVDPLDGTKEFLKQNDEFTVNIALMNKGIPILGLIYAPALKLMYIGSLFGTRIFRKRIDNYWIDLMKEKSYSRKTNNLLIAISRSHPSTDLDKWLKTIKNFETIQIGSSLKFCSVAEGLVDLYPRYGNTHIWDTAAGHAIINASGGVINNLKNGELIYSDNLLNGYFIAKSSYFLKSPMRF
jgi:3'(2'), 5'-bisphosphate nucleotidase